VDVLLIRPRKLGDATEVSYAWAGTAKKKLAELGAQMIDKAGHMATRDQVVGENLAGFGCVIFYGHGSSCGGALVGEDGEPIIDCDNASRFVGCRMYTCACWAGKKLGPALVNEHGCPIFVGYVDRFRFVPGYEEYFEKAVTAGAEAAVFRAGPAEVSTDMVAAYDDVSGELLHRYFAVEDPMEKQELLFVQSWLDANMDVLVVLPESPEAG